MLNDPERSKRILAPALEEDDLVALIAPGGRVKPDEVDAAVEALRKRGLRVSVGRHALDTYGHLAGHDADRAFDLLTAFTDPDVRGVFCARGGAGCSRLIPHLDTVALAAHPKVFVGYSDVTTLHLLLARHAGWPTFYGPMPTSDVQCYDADSCFGALWQLVSDPEFVGRLAMPRGASSPSTLVLGIAEGVLAGGTLCVLLSAMGTPYALDARGKLLLLEDMNEPIWRVDRMLTQLSHSGGLDQAVGFVIGRLSDCFHRRLTNERNPTDLAAGLLPIRRRSVSSNTDGYPARIPCAAFSENGVHALPHTRQHP